MLGVAITTSSICVGSRCPWVRSHAGAVSTQNVTLPSIGPRFLDRVATGIAAPDALAGVMEETPYPEYRQVVGIDASGHTAYFDGANTLGRNAVAEGANCIAAGNLLRSVKLPGAMVDSFSNSSQHHLAERLLIAIECGLYECGGEEGKVHSAALLVAEAQEWPLVDLRVDWDEQDPVTSLRALWTDYSPQMNDYTLRALDPCEAPAFGVPGDE